jgi:uncharacterized protein YchJ
MKTWSDVNCPRDERDPQSPLNPATEALNRQQTSLLTNNMKSNTKNTYSESIRPTGSVTPALMEANSKIEQLQATPLLRAASPVREAKLANKTPEFYLRYMFPDQKDQLLALGRNLCDFRVGVAAEFEWDLQRLGLIVPAYMTAREGNTVARPEAGLLSRPSPRCKENTGPLHYAVCGNPHLALDDQARAVIRLARQYSLAMVVHSAPAVIEAWFPVQKWTKKALKSFAKAADKLWLGSNIACPCKPYALPGGVTFDTRIQEYSPRHAVIYLDPSAFPVSTKKP